MKLNERETDGERRTTEGERRGAHLIGDVVRTIVSRSARSSSSAPAAAGAVILLPPRSAH